MRDDLVKKSLILGTILLLVGASVVPVVNTKQIQDHMFIERHYDESRDNTPVMPFRFLRVKFNITFYRETDFDWIGRGGYIKIFIFWGRSTDDSVKPVAHVNITTLDNKQSFNYTFDDPFYVRFWLAGEADINLTHPNEQEPDPDGGYVSGSAFLVYIKY